MRESVDIAIVGGGIIGCSIAYHLAARGGRSVVLLERDRIGGQALIAWSGLLALPPEEGTPAPLRDLAAASLAIYPDVVDDLIERTGIDPELRRSGALHLAATDQEEAVVRTELAALQRWDDRYRWVEKNELSELEPELSGHFRGAMFAPGECNILSPRLVRAYAHAAAGAGVRIKEVTEVREFKVEDGRITGLVTTTGEINAGMVILAVGAWSGSLGRRLGVTLPVGPLRGQIIRLSTWNVPVRHTVYHGVSYITPKSDGLLAIGSTEEVASFDRRVTNAGLAFLTRFAAATVPVLSDATFLDAWAGLRPLPVDGLPLIGWAPGLENVMVATGHARNGVLWSAITGRIVADLLDGNEPPLDIGPFNPARFVGSS
jgi:glycine oxidase